MAGTALARCRAVLLACHMTFFTFDRLMLATQQVVGLTVIELLFVEHHDLRVTPLVLGMTTAASLWPLPAMKSGFGLHISAHFLVAVCAQT